MIWNSGNPAGVPKASAQTKTDEHLSCRGGMSDLPEMHMLYTCPFCWKVRGLVEHIGLETEFIQVNPLKQKKQLAFTDGWKKTPVWRDADGTVVVDSTPIMLHIDSKYNEGKLTTTGDEQAEARAAKWTEWLDAHLSKATIPILYGSLFSALRTTTRVSKLEKFGFFSKRLYAWMGFPIMWGFIARKRVKNDGRSPKQLWHDLLDEWCGEIGQVQFFGGGSPDLVDFIAFGYMRSISPYPQFSQLRDHKAGFDWYQRVEATLQA
jgi:microsomal prostaglandin-E synthase 2